MNFYKYKIQNFIIDNRIKNELRDIQFKFNTGKYITKTDYAIELKNKVQELHQKAGKPTFIYHQASDVPSYLHYKDMFERAINDISIVSYCANEINKKIKSLEDEATRVSDNLLLSIEGYQNNIIEVENKLTSLTEMSSSIYTDGFTNNTYGVDAGNYKAQVGNGVCTLRSSNRMSYNTFDITIDNSSNGFPGNTHEVSVSTKGFTYTGEHNPRLNLRDILSANENRYFEFEMFNIDTLTKIETSSMGFTYKEGISWVSKDNQLHLVMLLEFEHPKKINTLYISALPRVSSASSLPVISEVIVYDDFGVSQSVHSGRELDGKVCITFPTKDVKSAVVKITQPDSYQTDVARVCVMPKGKKATDITYSHDGVTNVFDKSKYRFVNLQEDSNLFSIETLGMRYDLKTKDIIYPSTKESYTYMTDEYRKSQLFYYDVNHSEEDVVTTIIPANRFMIGISNIFFEHNIYVDKSIYISKPFISKMPIKRVILDTIEHIPKSYFLHPDDKTIKEDYIEYYLSFNDDNEWHRIYSRKSFASGPCAILINSSDSEELRNNKKSYYIDRIDEVYEVRLKISLRRHAYIQDESPVVNNYKLNIDTF